MRGLFRSTTIAGRASVFFLVLAAGCSWGGSRTRIMEPLQNPTKVSMIQIEEGEHTANVSKEARAEFLRRFKKTLYAKDAFAEGREMTIEYRIVLYDPGDQAARYWLGFGAGEGEMIVEASFHDSTNVEVARIEASGRLTMGSFGGDFRDAYDRVIKEIVAYAKSNFKSVSP